MSSLEAYSCVNRRHYPLPYAVLHIPLCAHRQGHKVQCIAFSIAEHSRRLWKPYMLVLCARLIPRVARVLTQNLVNTALNNTQQNLILTSAFSILCWYHIDGCKMIILRACLRVDSKTTASIARTRSTSRESCESPDLHMRHSPRIKIHIPGPGRS